ncbi:hypothetical protein OFL98_30250, partial [Escherichia coli]|nr:hypothetical protein [Escherichia coli]
MTETTIEGVRLALHVIDHWRQTATHSDIEGYTDTAAQGARRAFISQRREKEIETRKRYIDR